MRSIVGLIAAVIVVAPASCKTATGVKPMTVHVRDHATQEPVAGATVSAAVAHLFVPYEEGLTAVVEWFDKNPRVRVIATTNAEGVATFEAVQDCPVKIVIARAGYEPLETFLGIYPSAASSGDSVDPDCAIGETDGPRLEARFVPAEQ